MRLAGLLVVRVPFLADGFSFTGGCLIPATWWWAVAGWGAFSSAPIGLSWIIHWL